MKIKLGPYEGYWKLVDLVPGYGIFTHAKNPENRIERGLLSNFIDTVVIGGEAGVAAIYAEKLIRSMF